MDNNIEQNLDEMLNTTFQTPEEGEIIKGNITDIVGNEQKNYLISSILSWD